MLYLTSVLSLFLSCVTSHAHFRPLDFLEYDKATIAYDDSIKLTASPDILNTSGDWATVTWSGVSEPNSGDWIGVYTPPTDGNKVDPKKHLPVKFQYCNHSSDHLSKGKGSFRFYMVNMRAPYIFAFLRKGFSEPVLTATSNVIQFSNPNEPLQGHLMLTGDPTQMKLVWVTKDSPNPEVKWNVMGSTAISKIKATSMTYTASDMCGSPATDIGFIDPGQLHIATFTELQPGQKIMYSFGDDKYGWSEMYNFTVPPLPMAKATTRILTFGDMGQAPNDDSLENYPYHHAQVPSLNTTRLLLRDVDHTDLILHIGDISYASGYERAWDSFFDQIQPLSTHVPYMVSIGNHERDYPHSGSFYGAYDSGGECGVPYEMRFPMPRPGKDQNWYTFKVGSVQVVLMSTEHNFTIGSLQYNWIKDTLSKVDRSVTPWLIFSGHRPMYVDSLYDQGNASDIAVSIELIKNIESLLMQYKVDLGIWGHNHSYQKTCQVYKSKCTKGAPTHVIIGMAGQTLSTDIKPVKPSWLENYDIEHYGFSRITTNETTLLFEYVRDDDGQVHDTLTLSK